MIVAGTFPSWWIYVIAPVVGGVLAAVVYDRFIRKADAPA
jgi:glycerol uptake facilitator-like aquaporin